MNGCLVFLLGMTAFQGVNDLPTTPADPYIQGSYYQYYQAPADFHLRRVKPVAYDAQPTAAPNRTTEEAVTPLFGNPPAVPSLPPKSPKFEFAPPPADTIPLVPPSQKRAVPSQYTPMFTPPELRLETADSAESDEQQPPARAHVSSDSAANTQQSAGPVPAAQRPAVRPPAPAGKLSTPSFTQKLNLDSKKDAPATSAKRPAAKLFSKLPSLSSRTAANTPFDKPAAGEATAPPPADVTPSSKVIVRPPIRASHPVPHESYTYSGFTMQGTPCPVCHTGCGNDGCFPPVCGEGPDPCRCGDTTGCIRKRCCEYLCCCRYKCRSTCNMYPHFPYYPAYHGYYYFRPYNFSHVPIQKEIALTLGEDPAAPYGGTAFDRLYADLMIETYEEPGIAEEALNPTPRQIAPKLPDLEEILEPR